MKKSAVILILCVFALAAGGTATWGYLESRKLWQAEVDAFKEGYREDMLDRIQNRYFILGEIPPNYREAGINPTGAEMDRIFDLRLNRRLDEHGNWAIVGEIYLEAVAIAEGLKEEWDQKLEEERAPVLALEGDLEAQLRLFLEPGFDHAANYFLLDELEQDRGVPRGMIDGFFKKLVDLMENRKRQRAGILVTEGKQQEKAILLELDAVIGEMVKQAEASAQ